VDNDCSVTNPVDPASSCGVNAVRFDLGDSRYFAPSTSFSVEQSGAEAACVSKGYHLFTPESNSENITVRTGLGLWRARAWTGIQNCDGDLGYYDSVTGECTVINDTYLDDHGFSGSTYLGGANTVGIILNSHEYTWTLSVFARRDMAIAICERER
jgi:hypothetical protein